MASLSAEAAAPTASYRIGTPGKPWGEAEKDQWRTQTQVQRSYRDEVVSKLETLKSDKNSVFEVEQYGALPYDEERYPLFVVKTKGWQESKNKKPTVLVTGGVHGYETSGVQGALLFLTSGLGAQYAAHFDVAVVPCVSPWAYEHIQRWNRDCKDPNRSFFTATTTATSTSTENAATTSSAPPPAAPLNVGMGLGVPVGSATDESRALMDMLQGLGKVKMRNAGEGNDDSSAVGGDGVNDPMKWTCHVDLHETTDTDETEFMPARAAEAGKIHQPEAIPDGFYLVGDSSSPELAWHAAIVEAVRKVTHIAPPDQDGTILGEPVTQDGLILIPSKELCLCSGVTNAAFATTTEVYPDSPKATAEQCNQAQVAAITGALDFILNHDKDTPPVAGNSVSLQCDFGSR